MPTMTEMMNGREVYMGKMNIGPNTFPDGLPEKCYSVLPYSGRLVVLRRGVRGFANCSEQSHSAAQNQKKARAENKLLGVSKAQEAAMVYGSKFGYDKPGADPKNYDKHGVLLQDISNELSETIQQEEPSVRPDRESSPSDIRVR